MGVKEELHKLEDRVSHRELEDAIAAEKKAVKNGEEAQKKLEQDEAREAAIEAEIKGGKPAAK